MKICMVTYIREQEKFTTELAHIAHILHTSNLHFRCIVYSEKELLDLPVEAFSLEQRIMKGTKYKKIIDLLHTIESDYIISIDNDIKAEEINILKLIDETIKLEADISWGKVYSREPKKFISKLVDVDKLLSHDLLRPMLWKFNIGITIPGQCFIIKSKTYKNMLISGDTFLDDLALGLYSAKNKLKYFILNETVAYELPSTSFKDLLNQRKRWAIGYRQVLFLKGLTKADKTLVVIHGLTYHGLFIINIFFITMLFVLNPLYSFIYLLITSILIARNRLSMVGYTILYQLIFPLFHVQWIKSLLKDNNAT